MSLTTRLVPFLGKKCPSTYLAGIRYGGGGGGRPGGKPTFNWKERKALGITVTKMNAPRKKDFPRGIHLSGDFRTIEHLLKNVPSEDIVDLESNDKITNDAVKSLLERMEQERVTRQSQPVLKVSSLFGSQKTVGSLPKKLNRKVNFSHKRIFGNL